MRESTATATATATATPTDRVTTTPAGAAEHRARCRWLQLGRDAVLRDLVAAPDHRYGYDPLVMRRLLAEVDATEDIGVTLAICVQAATALPLLHAASRGGGAVAHVARHLVSGQQRTAIAVTDARAAGSDLTGLGTTVRTVGEHLEISGTKRWIVGATDARWALVLARHAPGHAITNFTTVLVPLGAPGVSRRATDEQLFHGAALGEIDLDRVRVPLDHIVGGPGRGLALFARHLVGERLASGLWAELLVRRILRGTIEHLRRHEVGEGPLWNRESVRHDVAAMVVEHQRLRAVADQLCRPSDTTTGPLAVAPAVAALKAAGADVVDEVLRGCARWYGADGFRVGGLHELRAAASMFGVAGGATSTLLELVADHVDTFVAAGAP